MDGGLFLKNSFDFFYLDQNKTFTCNFRCWCWCWVGCSCEPHDSAEEYKSTATVFHGVAVDWIFINAFRDVFYVSISTQGFVVVRLPVDCDTPVHIVPIGNLWISSHLWRPLDRRWVQVNASNDIQGISAKYLRSVAVSAVTVYCILRVGEWFCPNLIG